MGAWGYSLFENDDSCDVRDFFLSTMKENPDKDNHEVMEIVTERYDDQMQYTDVVLALAHLSITFTSLSKELLESALKAINEEIKTIHRWNEPDKRKAFLIDYEAFLKVSVKTND